MPATPRRHAAVLIAALVLSVVIPGGVIAKDDIQTTSDTTYTLVPDEGKVHVESAITLLNKKKPTTRRGPCEDRPRKTCKITTTYWIDHWNSWFPAAVADFRVSGKGVSTTEIQADGRGTFYRAGFPKVFHKKKQKVKVSYDLPDAEPGSGQPTRVNSAYAHFCWTGEAADRGTTRAVIPAGWEAVTTMGAVATRTGPRGTVISAKAGKEPFHFYACTDAFKTAELDRIYILGPSEQVVTIDSWPTDPEWREAMLDVVGTELRTLEQIIGSPMPYAALTIREASRTNPYDMRSDFSPAAARLSVADDLELIGAPTVALARTWFNESTIADPWLEQGLAMWAGLEAIGSACPDPGEYPGEGDPTLSEWVEPSGKPLGWDTDRLYYQTAAACSLVEQFATAVGPELMATALASLSTGGVGWRDFLDAIDGSELDTTGETELEAAAQLLTEFGVATASELSERASARALYHEILAGLDGTAMPAYVNELMESWSFSEALVEAAQAKRVYGTITAVAALSDAQRAQYLSAFEGAASTEALLAIGQAVASTE